MDLGIQGRSAVITGASQGIGRATAVTLAREGVAVILIARRHGPLQELVAQINDEGGKATAVVADLGTPVGAADAAAGLEALGGPIDILVNNVGGISRPRTVLDVTDEEWTKSLDLNLMSAVRVTRAVVPGMVTRGWGRVVHVASIGAREPSARVAHYAAAKAGVLAFSKALAQAHGNRGVTSNCVLPGITASPAVMQQAQDYARRSGMSKEDALEKLNSYRPAVVGRAGRPEEIAAAITFLASEAASFICGATLNVDGGSLLGVW